MEVERVRNYVNAPWILLGDFNILQSSLDKNTLSAPNRYSNLLREMISKLNLIDLPLNGSQFIYMD